MIGFDMGGTSTDVSRFAGSYEHVFESTTAGELTGPCLSNQNHWACLLVQEHPSMGKYSWVSPTDQMIVRSILHVSCFIWEYCKLGSEILMNEQADPHPCQLQT